MGIEHVLFYKITNLTLPVLVHEGGKISFSVLDDSNWNTLAGKLSHKAIPLLMHNRHYGITFAGTC